MQAAGEPHLDSPCPGGPGGPDGTPHGPGKAVLLLQLLRDTLGHGLGVALGHGHAEDLDLERPLEPPGEVVCQPRDPLTLPANDGGGLDRVDAHGHALVRAADLDPGDTRRAETLLEHLADTLVL
jgi:hypothetical protein